MLCSDNDIIDRQLCSALTVTSCTLTNMLTDRQTCCTLTVASCTLTETYDLTMTSCTLTDMYSENDILFTDKYVQTFLCSDNDILFTGTCSALMNKCLT